MPPQLDPLKVSMFFPTDLRHRLSGLYQSSPHIHNAVIAVLVPSNWTVADMKRETIGAIAVSIRHTLENLDNRKIMDTLSYLLHPLVNMRPFDKGLTSVLSSWLRIPFISLNLSAAHASVGEVSIKFVYGDLNPPMQSRELAVAHHKDVNDNIWLSLTLPDS